MYPAIVVFDCIGTVATSMISAFRMDEQLKGIPRKYRKSCILTHSGALIISDRLGRATLLMPSLDYRSSASI